MWCYGFCEFSGGDIFVNFVADCGHADSLDSAGGDVVEAGEGFAGDVDGEAVHGDPFSDSYSDGG